MPYLDDNGTSATNNPFITLIYELSAVLGPSSGLDSADVNPHHIRRLMEDYTSKTEEWALYALADVNKTYTRNLIDEGNGKSNLVPRLASPRLNIPYAMPLKETGRLVWC